MGKMVHRMKYYCFEVIYKRSLKMTGNISARKLMRIKSWNLITNMRKDARNQVPIVTWLHVNYQMSTHSLIQGGEYPHNSTTERHASLLSSKGRMRKIMLTTRLYLPKSTKGTPLGGSSCTKGTRAQGLTINIKYAQSFDTND